MQHFQLQGLISSSRQVSTKRPAEIPIGGQAQARKKRPREDQEEEEWRLEMPQPSHKHQVNFTK
jgi:hypothetical protein